MKHVVNLKNGDIVENRVTAGVAYPAETLLNPKPSPLCLRHGVCLGDHAVERRRLKLGTKLVARRTWQASWEQ